MKLKKIFTLIVLFLSCFLLTGCEGLPFDITMPNVFTQAKQTTVKKEEKTDRKTTAKVDEKTTKKSYSDIDINELYTLAVENGYEDTYNDFVSFIKDGYKDYITNVVEVSSTSTYKIFIVMFADGHSRTYTLELKDKKDEKEIRDDVFRTYSLNKMNSLNPFTEEDNDLFDYVQGKLVDIFYDYTDDGDPKTERFSIGYSAATNIEDVTSIYLNKGYTFNGSDNGFAFRIKLRNDLKWDNGEAIESSDFEYYFKELLNPNMEYANRENAYILYNATNYYNQGQSGRFTAKTAYNGIYDSTYDNSLIFNLNTYDHDKASYIIQYLIDCGYESYLYNNGSYWLLNAAWGFDTCTEDELALIEGKTLKEIKVNPTYNDIWERVIGWWMTDPNEVLDFFVTDFEYPEMDFSEVGFKIIDSYTFDVILNEYRMVFENGKLTTGAIDFFDLFKIVNRSLYEQNKDTYGTINGYQASWGPLNCSTMEEDQFMFKPNYEWYGHNMKEYQNEYNIYEYDVRFFNSNTEAETAYKNGELDIIKETDSINEYLNNIGSNLEVSVFKYDDNIQSVHLQSSYGQLKNREVDGECRTLLAYEKFRKALSISLNRSAYAKTNTSYIATLGIFDNAHYYDINSGLRYRDNSYAMDVFTSVFPNEYGYDLAYARGLVEQAYQEAKYAGDYHDGDTVRITFGYGSSGYNREAMFIFLKDSWTELLKGTSLEGKLDMDFVEKGSIWANDFRTGTYDVCLGGWSGAPYDPGYFLLAYLDSNYMFSSSWDTNSEMMTFTMPYGNYDGAGITYTMSLMEWYECLNGYGNYNWGMGTIEEEYRVQLIAELEKAILNKFYTIPVYSTYEGYYVNESFKYNYPSNPLISPLSIRFIK